MFRFSCNKVVVIVMALLCVALFSYHAAIAADDSPPAESAASEKPLDAGGIGGRFISFVSDRMEKAADMLAEAGKGLLAVPAVIGDLFVKAQDPRNLLHWGEILGTLLLVLAAGLLVGWILRRFLRRVRSALDDREEDKIWVRVFFLCCRTIFDIIPIAGFAVATYVIVPLTNPAPETRLIALALVNAAVVSGVMLAVARMICVPGVPALSFLFSDEETSHYAYIWIRRVTLLGAYGYFILEAALLIGIPAPLYAFLMKFLGLAVMVLLVTLILQNKRDVVLWLRRERGGPEKTGEKREYRFSVLVGFLRRLADGWHIIAIALVVGFYAQWALEIEGGTKFLLSGIVMTLVLSFLAAILVRLVRHGVDRLFRVSDALKKDYPGLETRANRYQALVRAILSGIIYVVCAFAILEAWGLGTLGWLLSPVGGMLIAELLKVIIIIGGALLVWEVVNILAERLLAREAAAGTGSTRMRTLLPLLKTVARVSLVVIVSMLVLSRFGINIGPLLAGAGVVGLAVGFGAQTLVRDMITGIFILLEDAISVGDWVEAGGYAGTVERLTVRTLTLRDLAGAVYVIPFGEVTTVTNYNREYGYALIDAGVAYRERYGDVVQALQDVAIELQQDEAWGPFITGDLEVFGLNKLADSAVEIRVRLRTLPMKQFAVRRAFLQIMKRVFDERGIEIPFPHQTLWFGIDKEGAAPPMRVALEEHTRVDHPPQTEKVVHPRVRMISESEVSRDIAEEVEESEKEHT